MKENEQNKEPSNKDFKEPKLRFPEFSMPWAKQKLKELASCYKGGKASCYKGGNLSKNELSDNGNVYCILYGELYTRYLSKIDVIHSKTICKSDLVYAKKDDVILPLSGETPLDISNSAVIPFDNVALGGDLLALRTKLDPLFLSYQISGRRKKQIARLAQGKTIVHSNPNLLMSLDMFYPERKEQSKISDFLTAIARKINTIESKIEDLKKYKEGLTNICFSSGKKMKISELINQVDRRNKDNQDLIVYSISNREGFVNQTDQFDGSEIASSNKENYKVVYKGEFAYNPARINVGSVSYLKEGMGQVSPMYIVFSVRGIGNVLLDEYFRSCYFKRELKKHLAGSVRQLLSFDSLCDLNINKPEESDIYNAVLKALKTKLGILENQLEALFRVKKHLLRNMFI